MPRPVYMDHHATTPVLREVLDAMLPFLTEEYGNPSSTTHAYGRAASDAVEDARKKVADLIGASPAEIVFTSGATESDNLAIRGAALARRQKGNHIVTCAIEHEAVLETCRALGKEGFEVTYLPVDGHGLVDPADLLRAIGERTILVSIQAANNEIGTVQPLAEIGRIVRGKGVLFHTDAVQAVGRIPIEVAEAGIDLLSMSAHKMYGPKGVGALYVRRGLTIHPILAGGGHEKKRRPGTLNVPGIVGFGAAAAIARRDLRAEMARQAALRDRLWRRLSDRIDRIEMNGHPTRRLPNNLNVTFHFVEAEAILVALADVVALSAGAACASGALEGSHVLRAIGVPEEAASGAIRFGLGRCNTPEEVDDVAEHLARAVGRLRSYSPQYEATRGEGLHAGSEDGRPDQNAETTRGSEACAR